MSQKASGEANSSSTDSRKTPSECPDCGNTFPTNFKAKRHLKNSSCSGFECPTCGEDTYFSKRGVKLHHKMVHDESLGGMLVTCDWCGKDHRRQPSIAKAREHNFCTKDCFYEWQRENAPVGEEHWDYTSKIIECDNCGSEIERSPSQTHRTNFCDMDCRGEYYSGENAPLWAGGTRQWDYGDNWEEQRGKARQRDGYKCQKCGVDESEYKEKTGQHLHVHHIRKLKKFDEPEDGNKLTNLITVCRSCHNKLEGFPIDFRPADD